FILYTYTYNRRTHRHMSIHTNTPYIIHHTYIYILILYQCNRYIYITSLIHIHTYTCTYKTIHMHTYIYTVHTYAYTLCTYTHIPYAHPYPYSLQYAHMHIIDSTPLYMYNLI